MIDSKLHSRLREINRELMLIEKKIIQTALRIDSNLSHELNHDVDEIIDYELDVVIDCYGIDGIDYPLCTLQEGLKQCSNEPIEWGLDDGENHNEFEFRENHPMFGEHHCWLFHCLYDHNYLTWEEIASIQNFWIDVKPRYQYRYDIPDSSFSPPTRHLIYSNNYQSNMGDVVRDISSEFAEKYLSHLKSLRRISRMLWGDTARLNLQPLSDEVLSLYHTPAYLQSLREDRDTVEKIIGVPIPPSLTMPMINEHLIDSAKSMCAGTVTAAKLALESGWSINLGGGFPEPTRDQGGTHSFFNDYALAAYSLWEMNRQLKILYIDLAPLAGAGIEELSRSCGHFYVFDISYVRDISEPFSITKASNMTRIGLNAEWSEKIHLGLLQEHLPESIESIQPDMIFYHASSHVSLTPEGMKERDLLVFQEALSRSIPIMMCLGNGYENKNDHHVVERLEAIVELMGT